MKDYASLSHRECLPWDIGLSQWSTSWIDFPSDRNKEVFKLWRFKDTTLAYSVYRKWKRKNFRSLFCALYPWWQTARKPQHCLQLNNETVRNCSPGTKSMLIFIMSRRIPLWFSSYLFSSDSGTRLISVKRGVKLFSWLKSGHVTPVTWQSEQTHSWRLACSWSCVCVTFENFETCCCWLSGGLGYWRTEYCDSLKSAYLMWVGTVLLWLDVFPIFVCVRSFISDMFQQPDSINSFAFICMLNLVPFAFLCSCGRFHTSWERGILGFVAN